MTPSSIPKALFVARGDGAAGWYRCALPAMALVCDWIGVAGEPPQLTLVTGHTRRPMLISEIEDYDVVILQQPAGAAWTSEISRLRDRGVTVLFEIDDYVHAVRKMSDHDFNRHFGKDVVRSYELNMKLADGVICSTDYLADRFSAFNARTWVCRNGIDLPRYALTRPAHATIDIGWAGGTGHLEAMRPWLPVVADELRRNADTRFISIGAPLADALRDEFGPSRAMALPFAPLETYPAAMTLFDIALAPAGRNSFFRAKSDLRWLEASALAIPLIADPGVYPEIDPGVTGLHADSPQAFARHLRTLVGDADLRRRVGEAARAYVTAHRTIQVTAQDWVTALREARPSTSRA